MILFESAHPHLCPHVFECLISVFSTKIMDFFYLKIEKSVWFWHIWLHNLKAICWIRYMTILYESTHPHLHAYVFEFSISVFLTKIMDFFCRKIKKNPQFWHTGFITSISYIRSDIWWHYMQACIHNYRLMFSEFKIFICNEIIGLFLLKKIRKSPVFVHYFTVIHQINMKCCINVVRDAHIAYNNCLHDSPLQNGWPVAVLLLQD